jgi:rubrerythrin
MYYMESQNPVIKAINASELFLEISKEERTHAQELEALLPKLKEKWSEVQRGLI